MTAELHPIEKEKVMAYLDGELPPDEAARVAVHLDQCAQCAELVADLRGVSSRMLAWIVESAPKQLSDAVFDELSRGETKKTGARTKQKTPAGPAWKHLPRNRWMWAGAGVTAVVLCVFAASTLFQPAHKMAAPAARLAMSQSLTAALENYRASDQLEKEKAPAPSVLPAPPPPSPPEAGAPTMGPMIARTASLNISVKEFSAARSIAEKIVKAHGGYISSLSLSTEKGSPQSLTAKLAIPAGQFDAALADLRTLGRVAQEQQSSEEVTSQAIDLDARLKNAHETETQLSEILRARSGKIGDVLEVEKEMARVRGEIEVMAAQQKQLLGRVAFASIDLNLAEEYQAELGDGPVGAGRQLWNALVDGYHAAADGLLKTFAFLLNVGPSLAILVLIFFWPARWAWRRRRNSRSGAPAQA